MTTTWPRTLADEPQLLRALAVHRAGFDPSCRHALVIAPCCGHKRAADSIIDVRGVPGTVVRGGNHLPAQDHDWLCCGCRSALVRDKGNGWTWSRLYRAIGAPAETIRHERAKELAAESIRAKASRGEGANPATEYENAHASLPADVRELPGTEHPMGRNG